jgi:hypothetical protein
LTTLGQFHERVRRTINRGSAYNQDIIDQTRFAVKWLERNYSFRYMRDLFSATLAENTRTITYDGGTGVKSVKFFRLLLLADSEYWYLEKGEPRDFSDFGVDRPSKYFVEEDKVFITNCKSDADYPVDLLLYKYTAWPDTALNAFDTATYTHWLLDNGEDLLFAHTLVNMSSILKSNRLAVEQKPLRDEALRTIIMAEEEWDQTDGAHAMGIFAG